VARRLNFSGAVSSADTSIMHTSSGKTVGKFTPPAPPNTNDRRRRARIPGNTNGWLFLSDGDHAPAREITVLDISRHGVGFTFDGPLDVGAICRVRVGFGPKRLARRLRVVTCRPNDIGSYNIGGEFA
jgi:hypothetical protein